MESYRQPQGTLSSLLTRLRRNVVFPMFSRYVELTIANGRNMAYTNKKTVRTANPKARFQATSEPRVEGSNPSGRTKKSLANRW